MKLGIVSALLFLIAVTVGAFYLDSQHTVSSSDLHVVCLEGVQYWYLKSGYSAILAVKYDYTTNSVSVCQ